MYSSCSLPISGGRFVAFSCSNVAFGMHGIILVASAQIRSFIAGVVTALATSPAVAVGGGRDGTCGRELALDISDAGF